MANLVVDVVPLANPPPKTLMHDSPPRADTVLSMLRSLTLDDDYFHRRALRNTCIQRSPLDDFLPQANEIIPGLFVSDLYTATSPAVLQRLGITHVVSVVRKPSYRYPRHIAHLCVPIEDRADANLLDYLDCAVRWVCDALARGGRVLVHCVWGMSRSASVAVAFLVAARGMELGAAMRVVRARRRVARPNTGFVAQLQAYERVTRLREAHAAKMRKAMGKVAAAGGVDAAAELDLDALARRVGVSVPA